MIEVTTKSTVTITMTGAEAQQLAEWMYYHDAAGDNVRSCLPPHTDDGHSLVREPDRVVADRLLLELRELPEERP